MQHVVTIDGPAGAGKSTVAMRLADRLGWRYLDTGAMYRAVTLAALRTGVELSSESALAALIEDSVVTLPPGRVLLGEEDVTLVIRGVDVTRASRFVADSPSVRERLCVWQRAFAQEHAVVTEGRDQGTLVFPDAFRKYFLTASEAERARRRFNDYRARGESVTLESVLRDQRERDARDAAREIAPMKPAPDAIVVDSTGMSLDEVVDRLVGDIGDLLGQSRTPVPSTGGPSP
jgi:cytidylate kinase